MHLIRVRIVERNCDECWAELSQVCAKAGFHLGASPAVPASWLDRKCAHGKGGLRLEAIAPPIDDDDREAFSDARLNEAPDGWLNLDATKNVGYAAREVGKYGSHSSHDRYDGDSDP